MPAPASSPGKFLHPAVGVALGAAALLGLALLPRMVPQATGMVGKPAPAIEVPIAANGHIGQRMSLAELKGRPVLLDFWASWCGPCAMEAPVIDRVARRYEKKGLVVMGVNVDDPPEIIRAYAAKKGLSYPMVVDAGKAVSRKYGVDKLPSLVMIDKEGNVRAFMTGLVDEASLNEIITAAL